MASGVGAGFPLVDMQVTLVDGSHHETDSSDASFGIACAMAFREGCARAGSVLLEPVMKVEVVTPEQFMGDINGDLSRRRGVVRGVDESAAGKIIRADVPLAGMFGYATSLRSLSQGRATHSMEFARYAEVPPNALPANGRKH
jgi:elongation factor G